MRVGVFGRSNDLVHGEVIATILNIGGDGCAKENRLLVHNAQLCTQPFDIFDANYEYCVFKSDGSSPRFYSSFKSRMKKNRNTQKLAQSEILSLSIQVCHKNLDSFSKFFNS